MERLIRGAEVSEPVRHHIDAPFFEASILVRKGHTECGDSAFILYDDDSVSFGVFDGVSGQSHASDASAQAAKGAMDSIRGSKRVSVEAIKRALEGAGTSIEKGYTTASICSVSRKGSIAMASVGDSPVYGLDKSGGISIELPLDRAVKEGDSSLKYFHYRNMLRSALGPGREKAVAHLRKGKIAPGEGVLMASDGLSDNLFVEIEEGFVSDASGSRDLRSLIGEERSASGILSILEETVDVRRKAGRMESGGALMIPKEDDLAIIVFRFK